jgi:hypothetical protein
MYHSAIKVATDHTAPIMLVAASSKAETAK